jgi:osmotically-inducible protein OsmY
MKRRYVVVAGSQTINSDAERIARGADGVRDVNNELLVGNMRN